MAKSRIPIPEVTRLDVLAKCNNRCCVCQVPFIQIHHIDEDPSNNDIENLAPVCPNCHGQAHSDPKLTVSLTASRLKQLRERWYLYCEKRREGSNVSPNAILKLKNFVRSVGFAQHSWKKTFAAIDPSYHELTVDEIINRLFATSNRDDLVTYLETVKYMYEVPRQDEAVLNRFIGVCSAFGVDYHELP